VEGGGKTVESHDKRKRKKGADGGRWKSDRESHEVRIIGRRGVPRSCPG